ncbi:MAG: IPTL-CTERM sorting domain-containing protein [Aliidongia sp.]
MFGRAVLLAAALFGFADTASAQAIQVLVPSAGFSAPQDVQRDSAGNLLVADTGNNRIVKILAVNGSIQNSSSIVTVGNGFLSPQAATFDSADNVYVADTGNRVIWRVPFSNGSYGTPVRLAPAFEFSSPCGIAVDSHNNVFVADQGAGQVFEIIASGGYTTVDPIDSGSFQVPGGVALDTADNLFMDDQGSGTGGFVYEIPLSGGVYQPAVKLATLFGFGEMQGIAVDASENVFVTDYFYNLVDEIVADGGHMNVIELGSGWNSPIGVAVDPSGNVYVTDNGNNALKEILLHPGGPVPALSGGAMALFALLLGGTAWWRFRRRAIV